MSFEPPAPEGRFEAPRPWAPDREGEERFCAVCYRQLPAEQPEGEPVCLTCVNGAREDRGEDPLAEPPW